jgi:hypothetical protein
MKIINFFHEQPVRIVERVGDEYRIGCENATKSDLMQDFFFGYFRISTDEGVISSSTNLIPALHIVASLRRISKILGADETTESYASMESEDEFWFHREGEIVKMWSNTGDLRLATTLKSFVEEVDDFSCRTVRSLGAEHSSLLVNRFIRAEFGECLC